MSPVLAVTADTGVLRGAPLADRLADPASPEPDLPTSAYAATATNIAMIAPATHFQRLAPLEVGGETPACRVLFGVIVRVLVRGLEAGLGKSRSYYSNKRK
jgi:hypothetical protein